MNGSDETGLSEDHIGSIEDPIRLMEQLQRLPSTEILHLKHAARKHKKHKTSANQSSDEDETDSEKGSEDLNGKAEDEDESMRMREQRLMIS